MGPQVCIYFNNLTTALNPKGVLTIIKIVMSLGIYRRPANLQTGQSVIMNGFMKLKGMGQLAIYKLNSLSL